MSQPTHAGDQPKNANPAAAPSGANAGGTDDPTQAAPMAATNQSDQDEKPNGNKSAKNPAGLVDAFRKATGLRSEDITGYHDGRRTVTTTAGGKYRLEDGRFMVVSGPTIKGTVSPVLATPEEG